MTVANLIQLKRSNVSGKAPLTTDLNLGEIAVNTYDGTLYFKKSPNGIESIVSLQNYSGGTGINVDSSTGIISTKQDIAVTASPTFSNITINGAINGNNLAVNVNTLNISAETNVSTQTFVVTGIGNLFLSEDGQTLTLPPGQTPITVEDYNTVIIGANQGSWYFKSQGIIQLPPGGDIVDQYGTSVLGSSGGGATASVRYDTANQNLTKTQQSNARTNIGLDDATMYFYNYMFG